MAGILAMRSSSVRTTIQRPAPLGKHTKGTPRSALAQGEGHPTAVMRALRGQSFNPDLVME